jgi:hypothetical protein
LATTTVTIDDADGDDDGGWVSIPTVTTRVVTSDDCKGVMIMAVVDNGDDDDGDNC